MHRAPGPCLAVLVVVAAACAEPNTLTGSIGTSHDLTFDAVALRLFTDQRAYELKYTKALESGDDDIVAKVVFDQPEGGVTVDAPIDLVAANGRVERITAANDPFPELQSGSVTFFSGGNEDGEATTGEFASTFDNGKTLNGTFDVKLEFASFE